MVNSDHTMWIGSSTNPAKYAQEKPKVIKPPGGPQVQESTSKFNSLLLPQITHLTPKHGHTQAAWEAEKINSCPQTSLEERVSWEASLEGLYL